MWPGDWELLHRIMYRIRPISANELADAECTPIASAWLASVFPAAPNYSSNPRGARVVRSRRSGWRAAGNVIKGEIAWR